MGNRIHELREVSQTTDGYIGDVSVLDDFGALVVDTELEESPVDTDALLNLQVGDTLRFGGGASPLMELKRTN